MFKYSTSLFLISLTIVSMLIIGCSSDSSSSSLEPIVDPSSTIPPNNTTPNAQGDFSYSKLTNRSPDCASYIGEYHANILDIQQNIFYENYLVITASDTSCTFKSNNIPNHNVGDNTSTGSNFASQVKPNSLEYVLNIPRNPIKNDFPSYVKKIAGNITLNGIMLNGVDLDMDSAFCYNTEFTTPLHIGLGTRDQCGLFADWYAIPTANPDYVVLDEFTGHSFSGRYHYHGDNDGLSNVGVLDKLENQSDITDSSGSPVIGFAPDGFPIYGHYFYDTKTKALRKAISSWKTYITERETPTGSTDPYPPISTHERGIFVEDWYYAKGSGDLDECNGMVDAYGNYGYYYTEEYPYGPVCTMGTPDTSFVKPSTEYNAQVN